MQHRTLRYTIAYLSKDGHKRGHEWCVLSLHGNGDRTMRAICEMDDSEVLRDVTYTVARDWAPKDAFIRVSQHDRFIGSGWFRVAGSAIECETFTAAEGRVSQRVEMGAPPKSFITHAVSNDVWHCANIAKDKSLGAQAIAPLPACSPLPNGASGPMVMLWPMRAVYRGEESVTTPAGTFACEHTSYLNPDGSLWLDTWCTGEHRIMVRMFYPIYQSSYELVSLAG
jgi:hypothetical protein